MCVCVCVEKILCYCKFSLKCRSLRLTDKYLYPGGSEGWQRPWNWRGDNEIGNKEAKGRSEGEEDGRIKRKEEMPGMMGSSRKTGFRHEGRKNESKANTHEPPTWKPAALWGVLKQWALQELENMGSSFIWQWNNCSSCCQREKILNAPTVQLPNLWAWTLH